MLFNLYKLFISSILNLYIYRYRYLIPDGTHRHERQRKGNVSVLPKGTLRTAPAGRELRLLTQEANALNYCYLYTCSTCHYI